MYAITNIHLQKYYKWTNHFQVNYLKYQSANLGRNTRNTEVISFTFVLSFVHNRLIFLKTYVKINIFYFKLEYIVKVIHFEFRFVICDAVNPPITKFWVNCG